MEIPYSLAREHFISRNYVKPEITVGNYYFRWDRASAGIPREELQDLKAFLRDAVPYLSAVVYESLGEFYSSAQKKAKGQREFRHLEEAFSPKVQLARRRGDISFFLLMERDGTTTVTRSEKIVIRGDGKEEEGRNAKIDPAKQEYQFSLTTMLGELVFDRQPVK